MRRSWFFLTFVWLLLIFLLQVQGEFPLNDDWQYAYAVKSLLESGQLEYRGYFSPIVLIQVLWAYAFHSLFSDLFSFTILRWSVLVLVPLGSWWVMQMGRQLGISDPRRLFLIGFLFCTSPLLFVLAPSFMSDVPFLVVALGAVYAYWRYRQGKQIRYLALALLWSAAAFYIRQPGLVLPLAFGLHLAWENYRSATTALTTSLAYAAAGLLLSAGLLISWEWGVQPALGLEENFKSDGQNYLSLLLESPVAFTITWALRLVKSFVYISLFTLPLLPWMWRQEHFRRLWTQGYWRWGILLLSLLLVLTAHWAGKPFPFGGNIFYNLGLGPELLADAYTLQLGNTPSLPQWVMDLLHGCAVVWGLSLAMVFFTSYRDQAAPWRSFLQCWLILSTLYLSLMAITSYYDRYVLLPLTLLIPLLVSLLPKTSWQGKRHLLFWIPTLMLALFSLLATHDYLAWNRARLAALTWLEEQEVSIREVDAGYEWNGWLNYGAERIDSEDVPFWWVTDNRYMIAFGTVPGYREIHQVAYRRWLWGKEDAIRVLERLND